MRVLSTSADKGKEFNANISEIFTSELFSECKHLTSDLVEVVVEVVVSYAFEVVSLEFAKKEVENNSKLKLMTYHKFSL